MLLISSFPLISENIHASWPKGTSLKQSGKNPVSLFYLHTFFFHSPVSPLQSINHNGTQHPLITALTPEYAFNVKAKIAPILSIALKPAKDLGQIYSSSGPQFLHL